MSNHQPFITNIILMRSQSVKTRLSPCPDPSHRDCDLHAGRPSEATQKVLASMPPRRTSNLQDPQLSTTTVLHRSTNMSAQAYRALRSIRPHAQSLRFAAARPILPSALLQPSVRQASTAATETASAATRFRNLLYGTSLTLVLAFGYLYITDTRVRSSYDSQVFAGQES